MDAAKDRRPESSRTIEGIGTITDAKTTMAKMRVRYPLFITFNYWVLYNSPDKTWFISATPDMENLWIILAPSVQSQAGCDGQEGKGTRLRYLEARIP